MKTISHNEKRQLDLEEYAKLRESDRRKKSHVRQTAIGLQQVDALQTSEYLLDTAKEHIEGNIDIKEALERI